MPPTKPTAPPPAPKIRPPGPGSGPSLTTIPQATQDPAALAESLGLLSSHNPVGNPGIRFGIWGEYLSGKTSHALSFPSPMVFNFDPNSSTIRRQSFPVPWVQVKDYKHAKQLFALAEAHRLTELARAIPGFEDYTVETLIIDSSTSQAHMVEFHLDTLTFTSARGADDTRARYHEKLRLLNAFGEALRTASISSDGSECYHIVTTIHEKVKWDEKGNVIAVGADITGDYNRRVFQQHDINVFCELVVQTSDTKTGKAIANTRPQAFVHTIPPSKFHKGVGDRFGGLGRYKLLPPKFTPRPTAEGGLWADLCEYWGATP